MSRLAFVSFVSLVPAACPSCARIAALARLVALGAMLFALIAGLPALGGRDLPPLPDEAPDPHARGEDFAPELEESLDEVSEPLFVETARLSFDLPITTSSTPLLTASAARSYVLSGNFVLILERESGAFLGTIDLRSERYLRGRDIEAMHVVEGQAGDLLVLHAPESPWSSTPGAYGVFDVADPSAPVLLREERVYELQFHPLPHDDLALLGHRDEPLQVRQMRSGALVSSLYVDAIGVAVSENPERAIVALLRQRHPWLRPHVTVYSLNDPAAPRLLYDIKMFLGAGGPFVDAEGRFVMHSARSSSSRLSGLYVRDAESGVIHSYINLPDYLSTVRLAEGREAPVVVVPREETLALFSLGDPANPHLEELPLDVRGGGINPPERMLWTRTGGPIVAALEEGSGELVLVDVDEAREVGRHAPSWGRPTSLGGRVRGAEGELFVLSRPNLPDTQTPAPQYFLEDLRLDEGGVAGQRSAYDEYLPTRFDALANVGGRYVVGADARGDTLYVMDAASGELVQTIRPELEGEPGAPLVGLEGGERRLLFAAQSRWEGCFVLYELDEGLEDGFLAPRLSACADEETGKIFDLDVTSQGSVVATTREGFVSWTPEGERRFLPLDAEYAYARLELSPDQTRVLLTQDWFASVDIDIALIDVADPAGPRLLFQSEPLYNSTARFVRGGKAILVNESPDFGRYALRLLDAKSGEPLGPPSETVSKFFYDGPGEPLGEDRFAWWHWTWSAWETSFWDLSRDTPVLLSVSSFEHNDPTYIERDTWGQLYLFAGAWATSGRLWLLDREGDYEERAPSALSEVNALRHGFVSGESSIDPLTLRVLRDPELNRPPLADAGPDQRLECREGGALATLDGRASRDPDSTPGTDDDLATIAWSLGGSALGDALVAEAFAPKGTSAARLALVDTLGLEAEDASSIEVVDTLPPEPSLALEPAREGALVFGDTWRVLAAAEDLCEGELEPDTTLRLDPRFGDAPHLFGDTEAPPAITLALDEGLPLVVLEGDPLVVEPLWRAARERGALPVDESEPLFLELEAAGPPPSVGEALLVRYELDAAGLLKRAAAYGAGVDHLLTTSAADEEGQTGEAEASLRATIAALCAELPADMRCPPGLLP